MTYNLYPLYLCIALFISLTGPVNGASSVDPAIDDERLSEPLSLPDWFKQSFLDIQEDINEANSQKRGLIIYFGQSYCPYCKAHLKNNWGRRDIVAYTRANFDVIAINTRGSRPVVDLDGKELTEKQFAVKYKANFTPTLIFFDRNGKAALKLNGYRRPYQFRAALEYVADLHHRQEKFRNYLARAEGADSFGQDNLNESLIFSPPPYDLGKLQKKGLFSVFFEEPRCHACDVLHAGPLNRVAVLKEFNKLNSIQLDMWSDQIVVKSDGTKTTAKRWADELGLDYAPTIIFYDETGKEIIRVDSVIGFYRLRNVLRYVTSHAYRKQPSFQLWSSEQLQK